MQFPSEQKGRKNCTFFYQHRFCNQLQFNLYEKHTQENKSVHFVCMYKNGVAYIQHDSLLIGGDILPDIKFEYIIRINGKCCLREPHTHTQTRTLLEC